MPGLVLPPSLSRGERPAFVCNLCGRGYPKDHRTRWERHVAKCADVHQPDMEQVVAHRESNLFTSPGDVELYRHVRKGGN